MRRAFIWAFLFSAMTCAAFAQGDEPLLLRQPTLSRTGIAFGYAEDIWIVGRDGGDARRLTTGAGVSGGPAFSPDGTLIAFTGEYDGNTDVYLIPAAGGVPRRLTYHAGPDTAAGWTPDGKSVIFSSSRNNPNDGARLFAVPVEGGGFPAELPLPIADEGCYSPDGSRLAYVPLFQWQTAWKRYRGGQTRHIWIVNLADSRIEDRIPRDNSNDFNPMWIGNKVYFLSDRNGPVSLFAYDPAKKQVTQALENGGLDLKSASAGPGAVVYEQFGSIYLFDLNSGTSRKVNIRVSGEFPEVRPHFKKLEGKSVVSAGISPTGVRAVFESHGEIFTVPAEKGDIRNLTHNPAVAERDPSWSPDGKWIAYFSDESGEYALHLAPQTGLGEVRKIDLGNPPSFYYSPAWSPDGKKIAYRDKRLNLWYLEIEKPSPVRVDTDRYDSPLHEFDTVWSPDSRWLAYTKQLQNHLRAVFVYSLETRQATRLTDGMSDALYPVFDKNGKYLYFTSSTNVGLSSGWLDMTSIDRPVTRNAYVVVLRKDLPSPLAPESDEEKGIEAKKDDIKTGEKEKAAETAAPVPVQIDFDGIGQRILALPIPACNYVGLMGGKEGILFLAEAPQVISPEAEEAPAVAIQKFDLAKRKVEKLLDGVKAFVVSGDGEKILYRQGDDWFIAASQQAPKPGEGQLKLDTFQVYVDPRAEWRQMYHEVWRIERDFLYDPNAHGLDLKAAEKRYQPFADNTASRADLSYLFEEMLGELSLGHVFVDGPEPSESRSPKAGLLGADYTIENGRYRFARVYDGENWNPQLHAPLTQPGVNVKAGEYLLAVNGRELRSPDNVYSFFNGTAGTQVVLKVGNSPDGKDSRQVTVVPVPGEAGLRHLAWVEDNRRKVDQMTGGRVAYVHLPDTAGGGYTNFNRYYFAQVGKEAAVLDERFNHGGSLADYIIDYLRRPIMSWVATREGEDFSSPAAAIYGPKVMVINEFAGSGGDAMPWYFRKAGIGQLVGKKTWGGLVGIGGYPQLMDGGAVTAPRWAIYGLSGDWEVENRGIAPDVEVEYDPQLWRAGHDPQLEKAVEIVLDELKKHPLPNYKKPPYPDYQQK